MLHHETLLAAKANDLKEVLNGFCPKVEHGPVKEFRFVPIKVKSSSTK